MLHCNTAFLLHWIYRKVRRTYSHFRPFFIFAKLESFMVGENVGLILLSIASLPLRASTNYVHTVTRLQGVQFKLSNWKHPKILYQFILFILSNGFPVALTLYESKSAKIQKSKLNWGFKQRADRYFAWWFEFSSRTQMLTVNVMINVMIIATYNGRFSLACAAGLRKYRYGNGFTVMDPISGTTL